VPGRFPRRTPPHGTGPKAERPAPSTRPRFGGKPFRPRPGPDRFEGPSRRTDEPGAPQRDGLKRKAGGSAMWRAKGGSSPRRQSASGPRTFQRRRDAKGPKRRS
jgi:hypothetical protein